MIPYIYDKDLNWQSLTMICLTTVTDMVITQLNVTAHFNHMRLSWTFPNLMPYHYKLTTVCKHKCNNQQNFNGTKIILARQNRTKVRELYPWSECHITFTAVYNPSSLDPGIQHTIFTESGCKSCYFVLAQL